MIYLAGVDGRFILCLGGGGHFVCSIATLGSVALNGLTISHWVRVGQLVRFAA